jgi:hypothetical protein
MIFSEFGIVVSEFGHAFGVFWFKLDIPPRVLATVVTPNRRLSRCRPRKNVSYAFLKSLTVLATSVAASSTWYALGYSPAL